MWAGKSDNTFKNDTHTLKNIKIVIKPNSLLN